MKHVRLFEDFVPTREERIKSKAKILERIYDTKINGKPLYTYLHTTNEDVCKKILENGFEFYEFTKTVDEISNDIDTFNYKLGLRIPYGNFTVIIQTLKPVVNGEDVTIKEPFIGEEGDLIFTLSPNHVKGYFNNKNGEFVENSNFELS